MSSSQPMNIILWQSTGTWYTIMWMTWRLSWSLLLQSNPARCRTYSSLHPRRQSTGETTGTQKEGWTHFLWTLENREGFQNCCTDRSRKHLDPRQPVKEVSTATPDPWPSSSTPRLLWPGTATRFEGHSRRHKTNLSDRRDQSPTNKKKRVTELCTQYLTKWFPPLCQEKHYASGHVWLPTW